MSKNRPKSGEEKLGDFKLQVPISASQVEGFKAGQEVKVLLARADGSEAIKSQTVKLDQKGNATASFAFGENPGDTRVVLGPADASDEELLGLQTVTQPVTAQPPERILRTRVNSLWEDGKYQQAMYLVDQILATSPNHEGALLWKKKIRASQEAEARAQ